MFVKGRCVPCSLVLKVELVPPSLLRSSNVPSSFSVPVLEVCFCPSSVRVVATFSGTGIVYNVYKFMKTESEVGITIPLSKVQNRVSEATRVSRRTLCTRILKEGENVETGVAMTFSTSRKLRPKVCTKSSLDNFDASPCAIRFQLDYTVCYTK